MLPTGKSKFEQQLGQMSKHGLRIAVVVPCYNVEQYLAPFVQTIPDYVHDLILVDDASLDDTGKIIDQLADKRTIALHLPENCGVGGAVMAGFAKASALGADVIVKMDGDGQMDPGYLPLLIEPLLIGKADYAKGNRFSSALSLAEMPMARRLGNAVLSFLTKLASGYWSVFDPTNGYIAVRREIVEMLPARMIHRRYFFESSLLITLGILGAVVVDVPMAARYGGEKSNLHIRRALIEFPARLTAGLIRRLWLRKILFSLTMEAVLGSFGVFLIFAGAIFGLVEFIRYAIIENLPAPAGTVMTAALPVFLGFQMVMNAILLDIQSVPVTPLCERFRDQYSSDATEAVAQKVNVSGVGR
jgi:glycosyltransferase involved in cell wall biosynthesis